MAVFSKPTMINQKHIEYLSKVDNTLKNIIKSNTVPKISKSNDYILDLYKYIIFQQISTKAGNSIYNRFLDYYNAKKNNISAWNEQEWKHIALSNNITFDSTNVSQFNLSGGSVHCLTNELF